MTTVPAGCVTGGGASGVSAERVAENELAGVLGEERLGVLLVSEVEASLGRFLGRPERLPL